MSKESGIFLQTRKEGLLRLITFDCSSTLAPAVLEDAFGKAVGGGEGPTTCQWSPTLGRSHKGSTVGLFSQTLKACSQRKGFELWLKHTSFTSEHEVPSHPWFKLTSDLQLQLCLWQCEERQRLSCYNYENTSKSFRKKQQTVASMLVLRDC